MLISAVINQHDVTKAINHLKETTTSLDDDFPLLFLSVVDDYLDQSDVPVSGQGRQFALLDILVGIICDLYEEAHHTLGIPLKTHEDRSSALAGIASDARHLESFSFGLWILYFCHVRANLEISYPVFWDTCGISDRQMRRYKAHAIETVTRHLIELERRSRRDSRLRQIRRSLPGYTHRPLFGRNELLEKALSELAFGRRILITGEAGIGKSHFVEHLILQFITNNENTSDIDMVLWLDHVDSVDSICEHIAYLLSPASASHTTTLQDRLERQNVILVLDLPSQNVLKDVARLIPNAALIVIQHTSDRPDSFDAIFRISSLDHESANQLVEYERRKYVDFSFNINARKSIGGKPERIIQYIHSLINDKTATISPKDDTLIDCLSLSKSTFFEVNSLAEFWSDLVSIGDFLLITDHPYVENMVVNRLSLIRLMRSYDTSPVNINFLSESIITNGIMRQPAVGLAVIMQTLGDDIPVKSVWLKTLLSCASVLRGQPLWFSFLKIITPELPTEDIGATARIEIARCYRAIGDIETALNHLSEVAEIPEAIIEIILCYKHIGQYEKALSMINRARRDERFKSQSAQRAILRLQTQFYIDIRNDDMVAAVLDDLRQVEVNDSFYMELFQLEKQMMSDSKDVVESLKVVPVDEEDSITRVYRYYLFGRMLFGRDIEQALKCFTNAYNVASSDVIRDRLILGRCLMNVAACYFEMGDVLQSRHWFTQAKVMQEVVGDKLGLVYTLSNLKKLDDLLQ